MRGAEVAISVRSSVRSAPASRRPRSEANRTGLPSRAIAYVSRPSTWRTVTAMWLSGLRSATGVCPADARDVAAQVSAVTTIVFTMFLPFIYGCDTPPRRCAVSPGANGAATACGLYPACVDDEFLRGAHGAVVGGQEQHHRCHVLRHQFILQALIALDVLLTSVVQPQVNLTLGHHPTRSDRIHADTVGAEFARQATGQAMRGSL